MKKIFGIMYSIKYAFEKLSFLKVYFSPFKPIKPAFYFGKIAIGTPYFYPRRWIKNKDKKGYLKAVPRKIGFDVVGLGWKTKYDSYRHEWNPVFSFVFFKWQIAVMFTPMHDSHYWECWLVYSYETDKTTSQRQRIEEAKRKYPCIWIEYKDGKENKICYWDVILKSSLVKP